MQVETFECEETATETMECTDEALRIIDEMGLAGQKQLVNGETQTRSPYRMMTAEEMFVYKTLCPSEVKLTEYSQGPIPVRVLQVASHANSIGMFKELLVWFATSAAVKDPVLVGIGSPVKGEWRDRRYILARWGDVLDEFPALIKQAIGKAREVLGARLSEVRSEVESKQAALAHMGAEQLAANGSVSIYFQPIG